MGRPVLLYSDLDDPLVPYLQKSPEIRVIHVDDLLPYFRKDEGSIVPTLSLPDSVRAVVSGQIVLNRILNIGHSKLHACLALNWNYHELWIHFFLGDLLAAGRRLIHDTGPRGVSRTLLPLNTQWLLLNRDGNTIQTPHYVYNFGGERVGLDDFRDPIQKSVWSLFDWREEHHLPPNEARWHRFFVEKPTGSPVLCYFFDTDRLGEDGLEVVPLRDPISVSKSELMQLARLLAATFVSAIGEFLVYVEDNGVVRFYAFSPYMKTAANHAGFAAHLDRWIEMLVREAAAAA